MRLNHVGSCLRRKGKGDGIVRAFPNRHEGHVSCGQEDVLKVNGKGPSVHMPLRKDGSHTYDITCVCSVENSKGFQCQPSI